jgi:hypothetical protein
MVCREHINNPRLPGQAVFLAQSSPEVELPLEAQTGGGPKVSLLSGLSACSAFAFTTLRSGQLSCIATDAFNAQAAIVELSPVAPKGDALDVAHCLIWFSME